MRAERGRHFDPGCVTALLRRIDEVIDIQNKFSDHAVSASADQTDFSASVRKAANA